VTEPVRVPRAVESLIRTVAGGTDDEERNQRASTFARGLAIGALVGAAIAGSTIWQRRAARQPSVEAPATPASLGATTPPSGSPAEPPTAETPGD
jgi:hypothetical protein